MSTRRIKIRTFRRYWLNNEILELMRDRDEFAKAATKTGNIDYLNIARHLRNRVNLMAKKAKSEYIQNKLEENIQNSRKFWRVINNLLLRKNKENAHITQTNHDDHSEIPVEDTAKYINEYFVQVGPRLSKRQNIAWEPLNSITSASVFSFNQVTQEKVIKLVNDIDINKGSALNGLSSRNGSVCPPDK